MKLKLTNKRVWDDNPQLKKRQGLCTPPKGATSHQLDEMVRFVHFFCDPYDSPLYNETDFDYKKDRSLEMAELIDKEVIGAIAAWGKKQHAWSKWLTMVMIDYLSLVNVTKWTLLVTLKSVFYELQPLLVSNGGKDSYDTAESKMKMMGFKSITELASEVSSLESEFFSVKEVNDSIHDELTGGLGGLAELMADDPPE